MKLRLKFSKTGAMKFIGHLDIMRYFQKAIRRAEIDIAYSEGYSPHQIMSFAAPLGVGLESYGEYFDIEVNSYTTATDIKNRLNQVMVPGMKIHQVTLLPETVGNAMASVAAASYEITFREGKEPAFDWKGQLLDFYNRPTIIVTKKTKKSELELDLKPFIYSFHITEQGIIKILVDASSSGNVKPGLMIESFFAQNKIAFDTFCLQMVRMDTYMDNGTADNRDLIPLSQAGEDF